MLLIAGLCCADIVLNPAAFYHDTSTFLTVLLKQNQDLTKCSHWSAILDAVKYTYCADFSICTAGLRNPSYN